ncbi:MAG: EF-hand domain-containing protein [Methylococcales bacterium]|nr:EF-hand domain-containing protein [Methylococcales bacterium]
MKLIMKPLLVSVILMAASGIVCAESYSEDQLKEIIRTQDDDNNNKVNAEEFMDETISDVQDTFDYNHDGYITSNEVAIEMKEDLEDTVVELKKHGVSEKNINKTVTNELNSIDKDAKALVKKMDADKDGLVEPEELKAYQKKQFKALDTNNDGSLSLADSGTAKATPKKAKAKGGFGFLYNKDK